MEEIAKYSGCFVCGADNECGLKARFYFDGDKAATEYAAERRFEGYHDIFHGGITAALMDEVMIKALLAQEIFVMTVELSVKYIKAIYIGQKITFEGRLEKGRGKLYITSGKAINDRGEVVAEATGKYLKVGREMNTKLKESLDR